MQKAKQDNKKLINKKDAFRKWFVAMVYDNMAMEDEAVLGKKEIQERSKIQVDNLIKEGVYKKINIPKKYYVQNKTKL
jgi:hypothetical protein